MIIITGGSGFIGSNLVRALNRIGREDLVVVDDMTDGSKFQNIADCTINDYLDKDELREIIESNRDVPGLEMVFHEGACSDTTEQDGRFMLDNNYTYSKLLLHYCVEREIPFIYASSAAVYGSGHEFVEQMTCEMPINVYAYSKLLFDNYVRRILTRGISQVVGLRYFNTYGPGEEHKKHMASVAFHFNNQLLENSTLQLFRGIDGYADGEQMRDFIHVDDVVAINLWFMKHQQQSGIFNVGTGIARTFNDVANTILDWHGSGQIEYIEFPEYLRGKYQNFTKASLTKLHSIECTHKFKTLEVGMSDYLSWLNAAHS